MKTFTPRFFYGWIIVAASFMVVFTMMSGYYTFGVFFKPMASEFGWTRAQLSLGVTINMITGGLFALAVGRFVDKYSPRIVMLCCAVMAGGSYVLVSKVTALWQFYALYGLSLGLAMSAHYVVPSVLINRWFVKYRGMGLGLVFSSFGVAQMISPPLAASLLENYGWRRMYEYTGAIVFLLTFGAALFMRSSPGAMGLVPDGVAEEDREKGDKGNVLIGMSVPQIIRDPVFWLIGVIWFFMALPIYVMVVHLIPYSTDVGLGPVAAALVMSVTGISAIIGRIFGGHASDRYGAKHIMLVSYVMVIVGALLFIKARSLPLFCAAGFLYSLFLNGADTAIIRSLADLFGLKSLGFIVGATSVLWRAGAATGTFMAGLLFDLTGSYAYAFLLVAFSMVLCLILTWVVFSRKSYTAR